MSSLVSFPYPTFIEIIRIISKALDVKNSNKLLYDKALDRTVDVRIVKSQLEETIGRISKYIDLKVGHQLEEGIKSAIDDYTEVVANLYADGISRSQMLSILNEKLLVKHVAKIFKGLLLSVGGPNPVLFFSHDRGSVPMVIEWINKNENGWEWYLSNINKENREIIKSWVKEDHLPSIQSIQALQSWSKGPWPEQINWVRIRTLLMLARSVDFLRKELHHTNLIECCRLELWDAVDNNKSLKQIIQDVQLKCKNDLKSLIPIISLIQQGLRRTIIKESESKKSLRNALDELRKQFKDIKSAQQNNYWLDWHEARWLVLSGDLEKALQFYIKAFEDSLFRSGINQKYIIEESLVVASSVIKPDKVFLKHLKNALIMFKYDIPSVSQKEPSNKFEDIIEDWEVENWKASFFLIFPKSGMFQEAEELEFNANIGPIIVEDIDKLQPDYRHPNRKIKVGDNRVKIWPQLAWFADREDLTVVKRLLDEGASVNVSTKVGDTPILMALEALNICEIPYSSLNDKMFKLISGFEHKKEIINKRTEKKRLLPIISAVESGRVDIVEKILELGADVNGRGASDEQTALNVCIKRIGMVKDPVLYWTNQINMEMTSEVLDSIRRHNPGLTGFSLNHQASFIKNQDNNPDFKRIINTIIELQIERVIEHMSLEELRKIALLLIDAGADVNAKHTSPVKGYTPLMLAAELDEVNIVNAMLIKGGNPRETYYCEKLLKEVDCWDIAEYFNANNALLALKDIEKYFPINQGNCQVH
jgi:ankyrin repeat protein